MSTPAHTAVFLSYASQDAEAARRICETLRASGIEVWFDTDGGLEHGDEWDAKIRKQIKDCVLFIPVISASTQARHEGYFRIEWELAAQRALGIASGVAFILPVVIDDTREPDALVPDRFRMVQWTKLRGGEVPPDVQQRFLKLWSHRTGAVKHEAALPEVEPGRPRPGERAEGGASPTNQRVDRRVPAPVWIAAVATVVALGGVGAFFALRPSPNAGAGTRPPTMEKNSAASTAPLSEARKLTARAQLLLDRPEMARIELNTADGFCKRAAELDDSDAEVWATWSQVNNWFVYYNFDGSLARREAARDHAARALRLAPRSFEARLAQACYWMRGEGLDVGFAGEERPPLYLAEAERMLRELHAEKPDEPRTLLMLGFLRVWKDPAIPERYDLLERVTKNPAFAAEAWKEIGWVKLFQGDPASAASAAERSIAVQPTWNNLWLKSVLATVWLGDLDLARTTLESMPVAALQEDVGLFLTYWVYGWRNEPLLALGPLERQPRDWLRMSGYLGPKALLTGKLRRMANQPELARRDFLRARELVEQALATDQNNRNLLSLKAQILHFLGEDEEARRTFRLAYDLGARGPELETLFTSPDTIIDGANNYIESLQDRPNLGWYFSAAALRFNPEYSALRKHGRFPALLARLDADPRFSPNAPRRTATATPAPDPRSVAVLAFANQSADRDNEYFSDGIADELLTTLQKIPGLRVAARTSAWSFKGKNPTTQEVGEKLGMAHVVDGSVQKSGNKVKITARLSRAATNEELWSKSYGPLELTDVFAMQSEIAQAIVGELRGRFTGEAAATAKAEIQAQVQAAEKGGTKNPEAHAHYLQARFFGRSQDNAGWRKSVEECRSALALDQNYVLAAAEMARAYIHLARFGGIPLAEGFQAARPAAERAIALSPDLPEANNALGWVQRTADWDWRRADASFRRAYELAPQSADMIRDYAVIRNNLGFLGEAIELGRRAVDLDPLNASSHTYQSLFLAWAGHTDEAVAEMKRGMELAPSAVEWHSYLARFQTLQGRLDEAAVTAEGEPSESYRLFSRALVLLARKHRPAADRTIDELIEKFGETMNNYVAELYAFAGDADRAFEWLERARARRETAIVWMKFTPAFHPLHSDPRWAALLKKMGLADEQLK